MRNVCKCYLDASPLQYWMNFFAFADKLPEDKMSQLVEKDPLVQLAYEEFQRFTADKEMRERIRDRERDMATRRLILNTERAEGRAEGKAEGKAEGRAEGKAETASGMLKEGFGTDVIARITGLSVAEIERLR